MSNLFDRLPAAREQLEPYQSQYAVVFEYDMDMPCGILNPDPHWMACALRGGILPPVDVYHRLRAVHRFELWRMKDIDERDVLLNILSDDFEVNKLRYKLDELNHGLPDNIRWFMVSQIITNRHILHQETIPAMTEEEAIEYLIQKDIPLHVWQDNSSNRPKIKICKRDKIPENRNHRDAWQLAA